MGMTDVSESSPVLTPQFTSGPSVQSTNPGSCSPSFVYASLRVSWTLSASYGITYQAKTYENGILVATSALLYHDKSIAQIEDGYDGSVSNWTYRVDIVRISDGAVVTSQESSPWVQSYGRCPGPGDPL